MKQEKMRKHHLMRVLLFTALPIILLYACRKELHQISDAKQSLTVEEAKGYMAQKERVTIPIDQMSFSEFNNKDLAYAWDKAKVSMNDQGNVIEVPLTNKNKGYVIGSDNPDLANKSITTLIVTKNEKGEKASFLMTLVADQSYLKDKPDDLLKNSYKKYTSSFSGLVLYHKPEGVFIGGDRYLKGQKVGPLVAVSELELRKIGSASSSQNKVMNYALPGDGDCTYYTMWDYNATCYPVGPDVYCEWEASIRWTYRVCSNTSGGPGGTGSSPDPYSLNNDLALPCEDVEAPDFVDTIRIRQELAQDALKNILPPEYHSFIKFGANGALDKTLLASAGSVVNMPQSNIYNVLIWLAQEPTIDINIWLKSKWFGLTTRHPDGGGFRYLTDEQIP
ncbi:hypothetical protein [Pedobacter sp. UC225_65]|uniref:hypothetical protein n=1 Tax=Pedobacter sp. UC225_65 TaxID=3350173 RepID=UPI00367014CC